MKLPLTLIRVKRTMPTVSAGWLASSDPVEWLKETGHCRRQGCEVAIYPVAASTADPRSIGVLLVPRSGVPRFRPRVLLLGELLPGVHAPLDAALSAGLLPNEREFLFPYAVHLFHPSIGLIGFEAKDEVSPTRLLEIPAPRDSRWNLAIPAARFAPALEALVVADPPEPEGMLTEAAKEIGDQAGKPIKGKPGIMGKAATLGMGLAGGTVMGAGWLLRGLGNAVNFKGTRSAEDGSLDRLREWAEKNWQHLVDRRSREIERLMKLMEEDPDAGLRHALPLSGIDQSRGVSAPTWKLGERSPRFSHGHGGGAINGWDLANDARLRLERQYRAAALREVSLGRHDRAAYIHGNLLGDWAGAAKVLADGGRHRDAVSIYLHKLNNRNAAARCLEDAGLIVQAAAMYAECKQFEKAGDLQALLGNEAQARGLWLAAIDELRDPIEKARIFSTKLGDREAALEILDTCWRQGGSRPQTALGEMFRIHREAGAVLDGSRLLERMLAHDPPSFPLSARLHFAHEEATKWEGPALAEVVEREAYRRIGQALSNGSGETAALLAFLPKLDPADLLLVRDAKRFALHRSPPKIPASGPFYGNLKPRQVIEMTRQIRWDSISTIPKGVSIAGYGHEMLSVAQLRDNSVHSSALRTPDDPGKCEVRHLAVTSARGTSRVFHFTTFKRLHYRALDRPRTPDDDAIGTLRGVLAVGPYGEEGDFAILQLTATSSLSVSIYSEAAVLRRSFLIDLAPPEVAGLDWRIAGRGGYLFLVAEGFLAWRDSAGQFTTMHLGETPHALDLSPASSSEKALLSLCSEVLLIGVPKPGKPLETVNLHSDPTSGKRPVSCFLPDGSIVIAWQGGGVVYPPGNRAQECGTLQLPADAGDPLAICASGIRGFAILTSLGKLMVFEE